MNEILFLGTGGGRFAVFNQLRHSGGIFLNLNNTKILVDPGPGSLIRCIENKIYPVNFDGVILTHNHLDHSADINVIIESMTQGGTKKKGVVFAPLSCINEKVILDYVKNYIEKIEILNENKEFSIKNLKFSCLKHLHEVETYGIKFEFNEHSIGYIVDTKFFDEILNFYKSEILIANVALKERKEKFLHLCVDDIININNKIKPKLTIITHFGMTMLKANPNFIAKEIEEKTKVKTISAYDNMKIQIDKIFDANLQKSILDF